MDEFVKSVNRFTWALSLFGVKQLENVVVREGLSQATTAFESVAGATEGQLGETLGRVFRAGDRLQRGAVDLMSGLLTPDALTPRGLTKMSFEVLQQSAGALRLVMTGRESRAALQEFQNKLQVFSLFENVDSALRLPAGANLPLSELVRRAAALESYLSVWATEGVGHYYAETYWETKGLPQKLLREGNAGGVPARNLAALHAGMGLSLANRLLATINPRSTDGEVREALQQYVALCRDNSSDGYVGAAYEALGLATRNLYPHLIQLVDRQLWEMGENLPEFFWHGVGRAIYFAPTNFLPFGIASRQALEMAQREPPHELGCRNALAGVVWAMTLVNLRHPEVIETLLRQRNDWSSSEAAFANGVSSAVIIWRDSTEGDEAVSAFCRHQPDASFPALPELWKRLVRRPCEDALNRYYGVLKASGCVGEVFRYQSLLSLVERVAGEARAADAFAGV
ncbi:MAG: hypothetical protein LC754_14255 [Acidobacteria bacterium]|nr:hypothetical protein [Acidobacteriota bacterium]